MPEGAAEGIIKGIYKFKAAGNGKTKNKVQLLGSGPMLPEAVKAQAILAEKYNVGADVWSVTSYNELRRDALAVERWNRLHPAETERKSYLQKSLEKATGPIIAATDYMKVVPDQLAPWLPGRLVTLGTDGFGRSEGRESLRDFFEVDARFITVAVLHELAQDGLVGEATVQNAIRDLAINPDNPNPLTT